MLTYLDFIYLLTLLYIGLKLTGYINWSWLVVLSPLWMTAIVYIALSIVLWILERKEND